MEIIDLTKITLETPVFHATYGELKICGIFVDSLRAFPKDGNHSHWADFKYVHNGDLGNRNLSELFLEPVKIIKSK